MNSLIRLRLIQKSFERGTTRLDILKGIDLEVARGEAVCIMGASGAGKSTLLHILGSLDLPTSGEYWFEQKNLLSFSEAELASFRNQKFGFVFQFHHLLAEFTALENVMLPCQIAGQPDHEAKKRAEELLFELGLAERRSHFPNELSGGEQQRVAIARALVMKPEVLFADEPTGNLDSANAKLIQELFFQLRAKHGLTLIVVSHDEAFARQFPRILKLKDGKWSA